MPTFKVTATYTTTAERTAETTLSAATAEEAKEQMNKKLLDGEVRYTALKQSSTKPMFEAQRIETLESVKDDLHAVSSALREMVLYLERHASYLSDTSQTVQNAKDVLRTLNLEK